MFLKTSLFDEEFFQHFACKALQGKEYKKNPFFMTCSQTMQKLPER